MQLFEHGHFHQHPLIESAKTDVIFGKFCPSKKIMKRCSFLLPATPVCTSHGRNLVSGFPMQPRLNKPLQPTKPLMPKDQRSCCDSIVREDQRDWTESRDYRRNERHRISYLSFMLASADKQSHNLSPTCFHWTQITVENPRRLAKETFKQST